jgi:hypothetical protein
MSFEIFRFLRFFWVPESILGILRSRLHVFSTILCFGGLVSVSVYSQDTALAYTKYEGLTPSRSDTTPISRAQNGPKWAKQGLKWPQMSHSEVSFARFFHFSLFVGPGERVCVFSGHGLGIYQVWRPNSQPFGHYAHF